MLPSPTLESAPVVLELVVIIMELVATDSNIIEPLQWSLMGALVLYGMWIFIYHHIAFLGQHFQESRSDPMEPFFSPQLTNVVEMGFWFIAFVEFYNRFYEESILSAEEEQSTLRKDDPPQSLFFSSVTSKLMRFSRYLVKYFGTYEKLLKFALKS